MRGILTTIILIIAGSIGLAQTAGKGRIVDTNGDTVALVNIILVSTDLRTISDFDGNFEFEVGLSGEYELFIRSVGYKALSKKIQLGGSSVDLKTINTSPSIEVLNDAIVIASKLPQNISDVFIPISVISQEQIRNSGNVRLHKIFIEQISLTINFDHGASIQIQNLNSEYIPILVDDDPLNGRTAWTLDFSRITINNIERIEVVKGLSSSLYGSEAIGGFINIITKTPASDLYLNVDAKYRSFNTSDIDTSLNYTKENFNIQAFYNRLNSDGYNLNQETLSQTAAPFATTTIQLKSVFDISEKMKFSASTTYYEEPQEDFTIVSVHNRVTSTDDSDIGIKGTTIHTDGGINGTGGVQATTISAVFDNLMSVPYGTTFNYEAIAINKKDFGYN